MQGALLGNLDKNKMVIRVESLTGQSSGQQLVSLTPPTPSFSQIRPQTRGTLLLFNFISLISSKKIITRVDLGEIFEGRLRGEGSCCAGAEGNAPGRGQVSTEGLLFLLAGDFRGRSWDAAP